MFRCDKCKLVRFKLAILLCNLSSTNTLNPVTNSSFSGSVVPCDNSVVESIVSRRLRPSFDLNIDMVDLDRRVCALFHSFLDVH